MIQIQTYCSKIFHVFLKKNSPKELFLLSSYLFSMIILIFWWALFVWKECGVLSIEYCHLRVYAAFIASVTAWITHERLFKSSPCHWTWWRHQMETFSALLAFVRGLHRSPANSLHKGQWRGALMFYLICAWINDWVNNRAAGDLRRHRAHHDVIVMETAWSKCREVLRDFVD